MSPLVVAIYDPLMKASEDACLRAWRAELLASVRGEVLEVGAGTGANLEHYPTAVDRLVAAEPDARMRRKLRMRAERPISGGGTPPAPPSWIATPRSAALRSTLAIDIVDAPAERLPFADASFDVAVSTLVLCSVRDLTLSLREIRRVLRKGGSFVFLEHVAAGEGSRRLRWQRRIEPLWKRMLGNCHLTRRTDDAIRQAGFEVRELKRESIRKALPIARPSIRGIAIAS